MMLIGLSGFGDAYSDCTANCVDASAADSSFDYGSCENACNAMATSAPGSTGNNGSTPTGQQSSWATALTSIVKGVVTGVAPGAAVCPPGSIGTYPSCACMPGAVGTYPTCLTPTPWYKTPLGIGGIVLGLGAAAYWLSK